MRQEYYKMKDPILKKDLNNGSVIKAELESIEIESIEILEPCPICGKFCDFEMIKEYGSCEDCRQ